MNSDLLEKGHKVINVAALMVSFGAYQVNAVMFGVDQLIDSSSQDISSYISWYVWVFSLCDIIVSLSQLCTCREYIPVSSFLMPVVLTLSVCSDILFGRWLIKEPVTFNPSSLFHVIPLRVNTHVRLIQMINLSAELMLVWRTFHYRGSGRCQDILSNLDFSVCGFIFFWNTLCYPSNCQQ